MTIKRHNPKFSSFFHLKSVSDLFFFVGGPKTVQKKGPCNSVLKPSKGQTVEQVLYSLGAITKACYERIFKWLVDIINRALATDLARDFFIGIFTIDPPNRGQ